MIWRKALFLNLTVAFILLSGLISSAGLCLAHNLGRFTVELDIPCGTPERYLWWEQESFSEVTGGRAPSFHDLYMGETAAIPKGGMRRGQNSPVDKSLEKTSPGASERKKSFSVPGKFCESTFDNGYPSGAFEHAHSPGGEERQSNARATTLVDLMLKDRFSMQLISGVLYSPVIENGSRPDFNYWQTNLRFIWVLDPEKTARKIRLKGNFDFIFELTSSFIFDGPGNVITGVTGILRYDFFRSYERFRFYAQGGVGIVYTDAHEDLSQTLIGNPIEFTPQFSVGSRYLLSKHWSLDLEAMFHHISNAGINDRNRGVNALGGFFGVTYYFSP